VERAWLVNASYSAGQVTLSLIRQSNLEPIRWVDSHFQPYYLSERDGAGESIKKLSLFSRKELALHRVNYLGKPPKNVNAWEVEIDPALSYAYDEELRFGALHRFENNSWTPELSLDDGELSRFDRLFGDISDKDPLKYSLVKEAYTCANQPVPRISRERLGLPEGSEEDYYNAFLLSRIANLPISKTYRNHTVSDWIRSMLNTYYRANNILIPNAEELTLGDTRNRVTGALTIAPESGTYFNMHILDFESLYAGCIDVFNLSYETMRCDHPECQTNMVPSLDYNVCTKHRGIYSALTGALRHLRIRLFKPLSKSNSSEVDKNMKAASSILKLFLVSCYGVTIRIHGLASPLLAEATTSYGRYVLQSSWDMAKSNGLKPRYGDTDSVFLDNPSEQDVSRLIRSVQERFELELAPDRVYSVCVLSSAKRAYFGISPSGEPEIKGLSIAKSNSPQFFQRTFQKCLTKLAEGHRSPNEFELAKKRVPAVVREAVRELREGRVDLSELEYRIELRDDPQEKLRSKILPQPYQAAWLLLLEGKRLTSGEIVNFVKVRPFRFQGRHLTVKPTSQASPREINVDDYVRNLMSSLSQTFKPMSIEIDASEASLSEFV
jgi:DNA polymerase elongation subunit (family B)